MAGDNRREATLSFQAKDVERFLSDLTRIEQKLDNIVKLGAAIGVGVSIPAGSAMPGSSGITIPTGAAIPAGYSIGSGPTATIAALGDPSLPMFAPSYGSPQQQRTGAVGVSTGNYQSPTTPLQIPGTGINMPAAGPGSGIVPSSASSSAMPSSGVWQQVTQAAGIVGQIAPGPLGSAAQLVSRLGGAAAPVAAGAAIAYTGYKINESLADSMTGMVSNALSGNTITIEDIQKQQWQGATGWLPFGIGARINQVVSSRLDFQKQIGNLSGILAATSGDMTNAHAFNKILDPGVLKSFLGEATGYGDMVKDVGGLAELMPGLAMKPDLMRNAVSGGFGSEIDTISRFKPRNASGVRNDYRNVLGNGRHLATVMFLERGGARPYDQDVATGVGWMEATYGNVAGAVAGGRFADSAEVPAIFSYARGQQWRGSLSEGWQGWAGYHSAFASEREAFGQSPDLVFGERQASQRAYGGSLRNLRLNLANAQRRYDAETNPALRSDWWQIISGLRTQVAQAGAAYAGAGREAGMGLLSSEVGILGAGGELAEIEGRSPAEFTRGQARRYRNLLSRPEGYFGAGVGLTPLERAQYSTQARGFEMKAIGQQAATSGEVASLGQQIAGSGLAGMQATGMGWNPSMRRAFGDIQGFVQQRIAAIDTEIQQYAAAGIKPDSLLIQRAQAQRASLVTEFEQSRAQAFQTKYSLLGVEPATRMSVGGIGVSAISALGGSPAELSQFFGMQKQGTAMQLDVAKQMYAQAVAENRPVQAMQAAQMVAQAEAQQKLLPFQQIDASYGLAMRTPAAYAGGMSTQAGVLATAQGTGAAANLLIGSASAMENVAGLANQKAITIARTPGAGSALIGEAWQGAQSASAQAAQGWLATADYTQSPELRESLSQARFGESVLSTTMGSRGSIRAMVSQRKDAANKMVANLTNYRDTMLPKIPEYLRGAWQNRINDQIRANSMESVSADQELQNGWMERVISQSWNAPDNSDLVMNEFSYSDAVMRGGVVGRHLGATSDQLKYFERQPLAANTYAGPGQFGTPLGFTESGLSGVTDMSPTNIPPTSILPGLPMSGGAPVGSPAGAPPATSEIRIVIVLQDSNGSTLGTVQRTLGEAMGSVNENVEMHTGKGQWN